MNDDKSTVLDEIAGIRDENKLFEIFKDNNDLGIKYAIVNRIDDDSILYEIFSKEKNPFIKSMALMRISSDIVDYDDFNNLDAYEKITYIETRSNESLLFEAAEKDEDFHVRMAAIYKISDRDFLLKMADAHEDYNTRVVIYKKLNDKSLFEEITGEDLTQSRIELVRCLGNEKFLADIAINDSDADVQISALKKLERPDFYFNLLKDTLDANQLREYIKVLALNSFSADIRDFDDFNSLDVYEKISYIESQSNESLFHNVVEKDKDFKVRLAAIDKISDRDFLLKMAETHANYGIRVVIYKKLCNKSLLEEITGENLMESRIGLVKDLDNEKFLEDIAFNDSDVEVQISALKKLNKPNFYITLLKNTSNHDDIEKVIDDIKDESKLMEVAMFCSSDSFTVENAVNNITNPSVLFELYRKGSSFIRKTVMKKLTFGNVFSREKITDKISIWSKLLSICSEDALVDVVMDDSYENLRGDAVKLINDEEILADIAKNKPEIFIRKAAVEKISDVDVLAEIAMNDSDSSIRRFAVGRIRDEDVLAEVAMNDSDSSIRRFAVEKISDVDVLAEIARNDSDKHVRQDAVEKISDWDVLAEIAMNDSDSYVRMAAAEKIGYDAFFDILSNNCFDGEISQEVDDDALADIAINDSDWKTRVEAVRCIANQDILLDIAKNKPDEEIGYVALEMIDEDVLADSVVNDHSWDFCSQAIRFISDNDVLADIAINHPIGQIGEMAIDGVSDLDLLADIARNNSAGDARMGALKKISDEDILVDILRNDCDWNVREAALKNISNTNTLQKMILENFGYFSVGSYSAFKRNYDEMIYESIGDGVYEEILDKFSDESVLIDMLHEKLFGDFRVLIVRRLVSEDALRNLALDDLDYRVRLEAVKNPNFCDGKTFAQIVQSDHNDAVRLEALKRIDDKDLLEEITNDSNPLLRLYAFERLGKNISLNENDVSFDDIDLTSIPAIEDENMLCAIVKNAPSSSIRKYAFDKILDERILANIVCHSREFMNRALNKITDNSLLLNIALYCTDSTAKRKAIKKIDDEKFLFDAVQNNPYNEISEYIIGRIRDESLLEIIAFNNSNPYNRKAAVNKIQNPDIIMRLGEIESEEVVCAAIVRKTQDRSLLEYVGLSNPCKTVRRYVGSVTDDDELLYKFALKEYEYDNRRELISRLTNEEYIYRLLKRESHDKVFDADFEITNQDMLIDLAKNSYSYAARKYCLKNIKDRSILLDFVYGSPFTSHEPKDKSVWEGIQYDGYNDKMLCLSILSNPDFDDMAMIEDFLIENHIGICGGLLRLRDKITEISSIYKILLNCKSKYVRQIFKSKLEYSTEYENHDNHDDEDSGLRGLGALFGTRHDDNDNHENDDEVSDEDVIVNLGALFG